ncbi:MAG: hypothetical protein AAF662_02910 [Pseudomonadota bacterium]
MGPILRVEWFSESGLDAIAQLIESTLRATRANDERLPEFESADGFKQSYAALTSLKDKKSLLLKNEIGYMRLAEQRLASLAPDEVRKRIDDLLPNAGPNAHSRLESLASEIQSKRKTSGRKRRDLAAVLLASGVVLLLLNVFIVPSAANLLTSRSSTATRDALEDVQDSLRVFQNETNLSEAREVLSVTTASLDKVASELNTLQSDTSGILAALSGQGSDREIESRGAVSALLSIQSKWESLLPADELADAAGAQRGGGNSSEQDETMANRFPQGALTELFAAKNLRNESPHFLILYPSASTSVGQTLIEKVSEYLAAPIERRPAILEEITDGGTSGILENVTDNSERYVIEIPDVYLELRPDQKQLLSQINDDTLALREITAQLNAVQASVDQLLSELSEKDLVSPSASDTVPPDGTRTSPLEQSVIEARGGIERLRRIGVSVDSLTNKVQSSVSLLEGSMAAEQLVAPIMKPYAYVVLTIAGMFITVGLSLILKWARTADDDLDDTRHLWETATVTDMVATLHAAGIDADSFSKLAASIRKQSDSPAEGLLPTPFMKTAREGVEIVRAVKSK